MGEKTKMHCSHIIGTGQLESLLILNHSINYTQAINYRVIQI